MNYQRTGIALLITGFLLTTHAMLAAGAFVEIGTGYNIPFGAWRDVYGAGMMYGGNFGFTFGEVVNPQIGVFLLFPSVGDVIDDEYRRLHDTEYISLFGVTSFLYLSNRAVVSLSDKHNLTLDVGYGIFGQRDYVTILNSSYESVDNLSGHGAVLGIGLQHPIDFSVFDFIHPYVKCYYAPNKVTYHIVSPSGSLYDYEGGKERMGFVVGFSLITIGEE